MILLTDLLFLDQSQFQYNPDYKVRWTRCAWHLKVIQSLSLTLVLRVIVHAELGAVH